MKWKDIEFLTSVEKNRALYRRLFLNVPGKETIPFRVYYRAALSLSRRNFFLLGRLRGLINFFLARDWRTCYGKDIRRLTLKAYQSLFPDRSSRWLTLKRFIYQSEEEFQTFAFLRKDFPSIYRFHLKEIPRGAGLIFSFHLANFPFLLASLGLLTGRKIYALAYNIFKDPLVPREVKRYFAFKYACMQRYLNGGHLIFLQRGKEIFTVQKILKGGHLLLALCDLPSAKRKDWFSLLGYRAFLASGAVKLAHLYRVPVIPLVVKPHNIGRWDVLGGSALFTPHYRETFQRCLNFLQPYLQAFPEQWYAVDVFWEWHGGKIGDEKQGEES